MPDDLAGIKKRSEWAQDRYAEAATIRESAADVPSLVAAVEAALSYHRPEETGWGTVCGGCWTRGGSHPVWPCAPMVDIVTALFPEEGGDD